MTSSWLFQITHEQHKNSAWWTTHTIVLSHYYTLAVFVGAQRRFKNREWTQLSATKRRHSRRWMPPSATGRQWRRWPYGSFEMFKTTAVERRWNICPSWSAVERHQLYSIAGKRTGTAVSRHRGQRKLDWRLSCDCRQQAAFIDAPRRWYYASMRFLKFRVTTGDGLATIVCASARSVTPHGGLTTLRHNSATFCCAPWRCSAIIDAQSRSTELSGGFHVQLMKFDTFIKGFKQIMYISGSLIDFQRWLIFNDLTHNEIVFNRLVTSKYIFISDADNHRIE